MVSQDQARRRGEEFEPWFVPEGMPFVLEVDGSTRGHQGHHADPPKAHNVLDDLLGSATASPAASADTEDLHRS